MKYNHFRQILNSEWLTNYESSNPLFDRTTPIGMRIKELFQHASYAYDKKHGIILSGMHPFT